MSAAKRRHSWRMPPLALLKPAAWSPGTKPGMPMLRGYLLISVTVVERCGGLSEVGAAAAMVTMPLLGSAR